MGESNNAVGEIRVRTTFIPSADKAVDQIKQKSAELINIVDGLFGEAGAPDPDANRLRAIAVTSFEEAVSGCSRRQPRSNYSNPIQFSSLRRLSSFRFCCESRENKLTTLALPSE